MDSYRQLKRICVMALLVLIAGCSEKESYREPEQWVIEQLEIADTTAKAGDTAQRVWAKLGSGESFGAVAKEFGKESTYSNINYSMGMRENVFDKAVNSLNLGEFSKPIREGKKYFIVDTKGGGKVNLRIFSGE